MFVKIMEGESRTPTIVNLDHVIAIEAGQDGAEIVFRCPASLYVVFVAKNDLARCLDLIARRIADATARLPFHAVIDLTMILAQVEAEKEIETAARVRFEKRKDDHA